MIIIVMVAIILVTFYSLIPTINSNHDFIEEWEEYYDYELYYYYD